MQPRPVNSSSPVLPPADLPQVAYAILQPPDAPWYRRVLDALNPMRLWRGGGASSRRREDPAYPIEPVTPPGIRKLIERRATAEPLRPGGARSSSSDGDAGAIGGNLSPGQRERLVRGVRDRQFKWATRGRTVGRSGESVDQPVDVLFAGPGEPRLPDEVFGRLQWGGLFVCVGVGETAVHRLADAYDNRRGFLLEVPPAPVLPGSLGVRFPGSGHKGFCFAARKTELIQPGDVTERFTYRVYLEPNEAAPAGFVVTKEVPAPDELYYRLSKKYPEVPREDLQNRVHKLIDHVFPTFLTREAAMLKLLQRDLPEAFRDRVPKLLDFEQDGRGFVTRLKMNWLRIEGRPLSQLEFAKQSSELLVALHDDARIMHLDLRLDNFSITQDGVCFLDFGSAVRMGESFEGSPMLNTLFEEMMRTSQIQRMLGKMLEKGRVTSQTIAGVHGKTDKTVDSFYLAVQINKPHGNPDLAHLILHDPGSEQARALAALTAAVLRPKVPGKEEFKSAADLLRGVIRIEQRLAKQAA